MNIYLDLHDSLLLLNLHLQSVSLACEQCWYIARDILKNKQMMRCSKSI